jgi:hypothetical protein
MLKNLKTRLQFISLYFDTIEYSHNNMDMESLQKSILIYFTKKSIRIIIKFHVLLKWNQNKKKLWYIKIESMVFYYKVPIAILTLQKLCV